jgi:hypothetical protein
MSVVLCLHALATPLAVARWDPRIKLELILRGRLSAGGGGESSRHMACFGHKKKKVDVGLKKWPVVRPYCNDSVKVESHYDKHNFRYTHINSQM